MAEQELADVVAAKELDHQETTSIGGSLRN